MPPNDLYVSFCVAQAGSPANSPGRDRHANSRPFIISHQDRSFVLSLGFFTSSSISQRPHAHGCRKGNRSMHLTQIALNKRCNASKLGSGTCPALHRASARTLRIGAQFSRGQEETQKEQ
eukprot:2082982-Amphidinium_carterae.2